MKSGVIGREGFWRESEREDCQGACSHNENKKEGRGSSSMADAEVSQSLSSAERPAATGPLGVALLRVDWAFGEDHILAGAAWPWSHLMS